MNPTTSNGAIISGALGGAAGLVTSWMWHILPNAQLCNEGYRRNVTAFLEGGPPEVLLERIETYLRAEHPDYIGGGSEGGPQSCVEFGSRPAKKHSQGCQRGLG
jgi:hypothetical protein